jgi:hypothetical protein
MDRIQQRIIEIALQIPEYVGYQDKDRRREMNEYVRRQLSLKYDEQRARLSRLMKQAGMDYVVQIENLDQKLQRLISRFRTAITGYAGWFDAAQIVESDLDQLTQFDDSLAQGVAQLKEKLDAIGDALKKKDGVEDAVYACGDLIDALNTQYDQREQFVAIGKKPSGMPTITPKKSDSPLGALNETKKSTQPSKEVLELAKLNVNDAVTYNKVDYIVAGEMTYTISAGSFWAFLLQDRKTKLWLRVGPGGEIATCQEITLSVPSPLPDSVKYNDENYRRADSGNAKVDVAGAGGVKRGSVEYARYAAGDNRLWVEDFGSETRVMQGNIIDASELQIYRK